MNQLTQKDADYWMAQLIESEEAVTEIIAYFLSKDSRRGGHHWSSLRSTASDMIGAAKRGETEEWQGIIDEHVHEAGFVRIVDG